MAVLRSGASSSGLEALESTLGCLFHKQYREILFLADGFCFKNGVIIYSSSEVLERNETFEVSLYAPGYLAIGDDSGGRSILISNSSAEVFIVDQGSMDPDDFILLSSSLAEWISSGCRLD